MSTLFHATPTQTSILQPLCHSPLGKVWGYLSLLGLRPAALQQPQQHPTQCSAAQLSYACTVVLQQQWLQSPPQCRTGLQGGGQPPHQHGLGRLTGYQQQGGHTLHLSVHWAPRCSSSVMHRRCQLHPPGARSARRWAAMKRAVLPSCTHSVLGEPAAICWGQT